MTPTTLNPYRGFRFPAELIQHAVWLYHCFSLSLREVELILLSRGIVVSYETIREWGLRFGRMFANNLKRRRPRPGDKWHLDEGVPRTHDQQWEVKSMANVGALVHECSGISSLHLVPSVTQPQR